VVKFVELTHNGGIVDIESLGFSDSRKISDTTGKVMSGAQQRERYVAAGCVNEWAGRLRNSSRARLKGCQRAAEKNKKK